MESLVELGGSFATRGVSKAWVCLAGRASQAQASAAVRKARLLSLNGALVSGVRTLPKGPGHTRGLWARGAPPQRVQGTG